MRARSHLLVIPALSLSFGLASLVSGARGADKGAEEKPIPEYQIRALHDRGVAVTGEGALKFLQALAHSAENQRTIARLIALLGSDTFAKREAAELGLFGFGNQAVAALEAARRSEENEIAVRSRRLLGKIRHRDLSLTPSVLGALGIVGREAPDGGVDAILAMLPALGDPWLEAQAEEVLAAIAMPGDRGRLEACALESEAPVPSRVAAIRTLAVILDDDQLPMLEPLMSAPQPEPVRLATARALANRSGRAVLAPLVALLESDDPETRLRAMSMLTTITGEKFGGAYQEKLPADALAEIRDWVRENGSTAKLKLLLKEALLDQITGFAVSIANEGVLLFDTNSIITGKIRCHAYDAQPLPGKCVLVTERSAGRVAIYDAAGKVLRSADGLQEPCDAELLDNGHLLVLENTAGRVVEIDAEGNHVWSIDGLETPFDVDRLANGNTLVADSGGGRLVEFDPQGNSVWEVRGLDFPNSVLRFSDGRTLYTTYTSGGIVMLDPTGKQLWSRVFDGATLFSVGLGRGRLYVSDGETGRVLILGLDGTSITTAALKQGFIDVGFIRE